MVTIDKTRSLIQKQKSLKKLGDIRDYLFRQDLIARANLNHQRVIRDLKHEYSCLIEILVIYGFDIKNYLRIREITRLLREEDINELLDPVFNLKTDRIDHLKSQFRDYKVYQETK